ncbi:hypothetical protein SAMN05421846_101406 [Chryseobacterium taeanense]|uniref:Uncharacterized protein n=1 Tax=Chryseobacterium taeanense TaxID=311334 RepID=A0A1G8E358_9FLAO|nr:hypothetical protein [Chryseobacterium taeanense]SDH64373.1 hypothetical protein SAMN05421846_101406 [Chryseobacterium taeanense]
MSQDLTNKEFQKLVKKHLEKSHYVKVYFFEDSPEELTSGFILKFSNDFLMLHESHNFTLDGIKLIPLNRISGFRHSKLEKTSEKIFLEEGLTTFNQKIINNTSLKNFESLFKSIKKQDFHCIVEGRKKDKYTFSIGDILEVNEKTVVIKNYDATGKFDKKPSKIFFKNIHFITFNDKYSRTFRKYLKD